MNSFRVIEAQQTICENSFREAYSLRKELRRDKVFLLNLVSSPGSGKTSVLTRTIRALKDSFNIAVLETDIDSDIDARVIAETGARVIRLHTGGMCQLDAGMTRRGLEALGTGGLDLVFLENTGNLRCHKESDTGAEINVMILSVPEGDDKPLKYPLMFSTCDALLINKIDALPAFDFDLELCVKRVKKLNPYMKIIPMSAKTGEGIDEWSDWLRDEISRFHTENARLDA